MLMLKRMGSGAVVAGFAVLGFLCSVAPATAGGNSNDPAAILIWPKVVVNSTGVCVGGANDGQACTVNCGLNSVCRKTDTLISITHAGTNFGPAAMAHCFYINGNSHCSNDGDVCTSYLDCAYGTGQYGACVPGWSEYNFDVRISPSQPLAWSASAGLSGEDLFLAANAGTRVPPVPEDPFIGELKCIQVDEGAGDRLPATCQGDGCRNDLMGQATIESVDDTGLVDPATYSAIGLRALDVNSDGELILGGPAAEYDGCAQVLIFDHLFDGAVDPISGCADVGLCQRARSELTLAPCSEDLLAQVITPVTAQFLVYNEFEQRFSTSRQIPCVVNSPISLIDTSQPARSIFSAGVAGTVAGQTRIMGVNGGLMGVATLAFREETVGTTPAAPTVATGGYNLNQWADRESADVIRIPSGRF